MTYSHLSRILRTISILLFQLSIISSAWLLSATNVPFMVIFVSIIVLAYIINSMSDIFQRDTVKSKTTDVSLLFFFMFVVYTFIQAYNVREVRIRMDTYSLVEKHFHFNFLPSSILDNFLNFNALSYACVFLGLYCFLALSLKFFRYKKIRDVSLSIFSVNALIMGIFALWQKQHYSIMFNTYFSTGDFFGTFFLSNACGAYLTIATSIFLTYTLDFNRITPSIIFLKILSLICAITTSYCVYKTNSMGAILCCAIVICVLLYSSLYFYWKKTAISLLIITAIAFGATMSHFHLVDKVEDFVKSNSELKEAATLNGRIPILRESFLLFKKFPTFGSGFSAFEVETNRNKYVGDNLINLKGYVNLNNPHSSPIHFLVSCGIVGSSILLIAFILLCYKIVIHPRRYSLKNILFFESAIICFLYSFLDMHLSAIPVTMMAFLMLLVAGRTKIRKFYYEDF